MRFNDIYIFDKPTRICGLAGWEAIDAQVICLGAADSLGGSGLLAC